MRLNVNLPTQRLLVVATREVSPLKKLHSLPFSDDHSQTKCETTTRHDIKAPSALFSEEEREEIKEPLI